MPSHSFRDLFFRARVSRSHRMGQSVNNRDARIADVLVRGKSLDELPRFVGKLHSRFADLFLEYSHLFRLRLARPPIRRRSQRFMDLFNFRPRLRRIIGKRVPRRLLVLRKAWWLQNEGSRREEQDSNGVYRTHLSYWPRRSPTETSRH